MTRSRLTSGFLITAVISGLLVGLPALSARADPTACPTAFPTVDAIDGLTATGYTVERGTDPEPFTAQILGRITNGVAPGIDMIMANLSSPALTRSGGVWAGMSGSPVYASDGRLIGSVSYGLAASSPIAGITPAEDMMKLLTTSISASSTSKIAAESRITERSRITISARTASRIAATGTVSKATAAEGFQRLQLPLTVGGSLKGSTKFLSNLAKVSGAQVRAGGIGAVRAAASSPAEIIAGGNFAMALAYGDVTIGGVGTTTFVCDGKAVAFGHPYADQGDVEYTAHPASSVLIQPDPIGGPFKVANIGGPVGVVDLDNTTGLRAELGATPTGSFTVASTLTPTGGAPVTGTTTGVYQPAAADIAAMHLETDVAKALGSAGPGSAALRFRIDGVRSNGTPFVLRRADHYSDAADIGFAAADDLYTTLSALTTQTFDNVKITGVHILGTVSHVVKQYRVTGVQIRGKGRWVSHKGLLRVNSGHLVRTLLTLTNYRSSKTAQVRLTIKVPARAEGASGDLLISDALDAGSGSVDAKSGLASASVADPNSLTELLAQLAALPRNDALAGTLLLDTGGKSVTAVALKTTDAAVTPYLKDFPILVNS